MLLFPLKQQPIPAHTLFLPTESSLDERVSALHFVAWQFEQYLLVLPEVFDNKPPNIRVLLHYEYWYF